jgi:Carboxypeptidase regulatory-like domain
MVGAGNISLVWTLLLALVLPVCAAQERFESGFLRGFTNVLYVQEDISAPDVRIRSVRGTITRAVGDKSGLPDALVEIIGPGDSDQLFSARTDDKGRFLIPSVPHGAYRFRVASRGFNAFSGKLIVSKDAPRGSTMSFALPLSN